MVDLATKMKIDSLIDMAYNQMIEIFNINEQSPESSIYRTMVVVKGDSVSYLNAYINYYMGVFEGILITLFLDQLEAYPNPSEKSFMQDSFMNRFHDFTDMAVICAKKHYKKDLD